MQRRGLVAPLRRDQQEPNHAAVVHRRLVRAEIVAGAPDRRDFLFGQHALALCLRRAPDGRHDIGLDQIFLAAQRITGPSEASSAVGRGGGAGLDQLVAHGAQIVLQNSPAGSAR